MNPNLSPLIELQKYDLRIMEIRELRRRIPERLETGEAPLRESKRLLQDTTAAVEALVKERRAHEKDLEIHEGHTEKMKTRLSELKTNKEYQAHLFEIDMANKKKGEIEDKILALMEKIEQMQRTVTDLQAKVAAAEQVFSQEKSMLDESDRSLAAELGRLEAEQQTRAARVEKALLDRYTKLKASRKDQALAAVRDGMCCGCRLQVPPQLIAEVKRSHDLHTCPYCYRMLYWEGDPVSEAKAPQELLNASDLEMGESA